MTHAIRGDYFREKVFLMTDILDYISTWSVLKWVVLVLIAGFIGQFGRMMAEAIVAKIRLRRAKWNPSADEKKTPEAPGVLPAEVPSMGLPAKSAQEPGLPIDVSQTNASPGLSPSSAVPDKKALKAIVKARKKEAKKNLS
jgi:hypothetical protein